MRRSILTRLALFSVCFAAGGCRGSQHATSHLMTPPDGVTRASSAYYSPNNASASTSAGSTSTVVSPTTTVVSSPSPTFGSAASTGITPRDTVTVSNRLPQDQQPIRIVEGSPGKPNSSLATRGMNVNDGMAAQPWYRPSGMQPLPFTETAARPTGSLRGTTNSFGGSQAGNYSQSDGQWKSRSSYEPGERR